LKRQNLNTAGVDLFHTSSLSIRSDEFGPQARAFIKTHLVKAMMLMSIQGLKFSVDAVLCTSARLLHSGQRNCTTSLLSTMKDPARSCLPRSQPDECWYDPKAFTSQRSLPSSFR
jgi:hypothetical protein